MYTLHRAPLIYKPAIYQIKSPHNELVSSLKWCFWTKNVFRVGQEFGIFFKKNRSEKYVGSAQGSPNLK